MQRAFLDTTVFVFGIIHEKSNSSKILKLLETTEIKAVTSELAIREIVKVFKRLKSEEDAYYAAKYVLGIVEVIPKRKILAKIKQFKGQIKEKDLEHLATAKQQKVEVIISYDRDFKNFSEYKTPKQFITSLGIKPEETEY